MTEAGTPKRHNTFIDIPDSLRLPRFMMADDAHVDESDEFNTEYKLVLQSVVCHRGDSLHSGHYISFARVNPKLLTDNRRHDHDPPPDYEEPQWVKFDDLHLDSRVSYVDDIKKSLREEMPYLLFYQIVPMVDVTTASTEDTDPEPPSYDDSTLNVPGIQTPNLDLDRSDISRKASGYFESTTWSTSGPSIRFSSELDRPSRVSFDEESNTSGAHLKAGSPRRGSVALTDSAEPSPAVTPDAPSPAVTPSEETAAQRLSRAAARFTKSGGRSRPASQAGENRISTTMSRLGLMRTSREPLRGTEDGSSSELVPEALPGDGQHHSYSLRKGKERGKSKSREKDAEKAAGKEKDKVKTDKVKTNKAGVPERECVVM